VRGEAGRPGHPTHLHPESRIPTPESRSAVAFQGELGAFSEEAIPRLWPKGARPLPCRDFLEVARAVQCGEAAHGLLPIENTLAGSVVGSYDALVAFPALHVIAETVIEIHHCVLAVRGATIDALTSVESHPVALAQCGEWLRAHPSLRAQVAYDTAGAAGEVAARGDPRLAAIAGRAAAARYGLEILAANVEDRPDNQTRFLAIAPAPRAPTPGTQTRTALILTTANVPGALLRVLQPLAEHGINMSKLESRPTGEPWSYRFFIELEHAAGDPRATTAISDLARATESLRVLGCYPRWESATSSSC
jgi:prephenate dehydratase